MTRRSREHFGTALVSFSVSVSVSVSVTCQDSRSSTIKLTENNRKKVSTKSLFYIGVNKTDACIVYCIGNSICISIGITVEPHVEDQASVEVISLQRVASLEQENAGNRKKITSFLIVWTLSYLSLHNLKLERPLPFPGLPRSTQDDEELEVSSSSLGSSASLSRRRRRRRRRRHPQPLK